MVKLAVPVAACCWCWVVGCTMDAAIAKGDAGSTAAATGGSGSAVDAGDDADAATVDANSQLVPDLILLSVLAEEGFNGQVWVTDGCQGLAIETEPKPVVLELVVDVSGSMNDLAPGDTRTKWNLTRAALIEAMSFLPSFAAAGVLFYPNMVTPVNLAEPQLPPPCIDAKDDVEIGLLSTVGSEQRVAMEAAFNRVQPVSGSGTPTHDAYLLALDKLEQTTYAGDRFMLLITDGQPTFSQGCYGWGSAEYPVATQPIVDEVTSAAAGGIRTFVVGSPGSEDTRGWLSAAARAGGTVTRADCSDDGPLYCHFDMTQSPDFAGTLSQGLRTITSNMMSCIYGVVPPSSGAQLNLDRVNVIYTQGDGTQYAVVKNAAPTCDRGWHYINNGSEIEICGETCDRIRIDPGARMDIVFECKEVLTVY